MSKLTGVAVTMPDDADVNVNDPDAAMHLYRIAQEAVANAVRHSGATQVQLLLHADDGKLILEVADNGRGMPASESMNHEGMGLRTMRYRAQMLGADLQVISKPDAGTAVRCFMKAKTESIL